MRVVRADGIPVRNYIVPRCESRHTENAKPAIHYYCFITVFAVLSMILTSRRYLYFGTSPALDLISWISRSNGGRAEVLYVHKTRPRWRSHEMETYSGKEWMRLNSSNHTSDYAIARLQLVCAQFNVFTRNGSFAGWNVLKFNGSTSLIITIHLSLEWLTITTKQVRSGVSIGRVCVHYYL